MRIWPWPKKESARKLRLPIQRHLAIDLAEAQSVQHDIKPIQRINLQRVLDRWADRPDAHMETFGFSTAGYYRDDGVVRYLITDELIQAPLERIQLDSGPEETLDCVLRGLFLFHHEGTPVVVAIRPPQFTHDPPVLEVIGPTREAARRTLTALLNEAQRDSVYKGHIVSLEPSESWRQQEAVVRFQEVRPVRREDIVLPEEVIQIVERNVFGMLRHAQTLRETGRSLRRGLLFHGPPGTGKTLMVRYLAQARADHTVILLTGSEQPMVREACQIARLLAPSMVVLEDVDLVAEERERNRCPVILHELMNEMDGLRSRDEVMFVLTTTRPDMIEPALSARPGRIDQAIAFPLPDDECRRRLFAVYGRGLDLSAVDQDRWVSQTDGVSPAFIEELLRKATLLAAERGETTRPLSLADDDLGNAIRELVQFGGELTQKLLGYQTRRLGYQPAAGG